MRAGAVDAELSGYPGLGSADIDHLAGFCELFRFQLPSASFIHAAGFGCLDAFGLAFLADLTLQLGEGGHDVQLELRERIPGIGTEAGPLAQELDGDVLGDQFGNDLVQVDHRSGKPVHGGNHHDVTGPGMGGHLSQGVASGALGVVLLLFEEAVHLSEGGQLAGEVLVGARDRA